MVQSNVPVSEYVWLAVRSTVAFPGYVVLTVPSPQLTETLDIVQPVGAVIVAVTVAIIPVVVADGEEIVGPVVHAAGAANVPWLRSTKAAPTIINVTTAIASGLL